MTDKTLTYNDTLKGEEQKKFILKVYRIFIYSLLYSAISSYFSIQLNFQFSWWWVLLEIVIFLICIFSEKSLFFLYLWTVASGFNSGPILSNLFNEGNGSIIWKSLLLTCLIFAILSVYVFYTKKDYSHWGAILFAFLTILVLSIIPLIIFPNKTAIIIFSAIGILLFCAYVLFDTSNIIHQYKTGDEVMAALDLHLDFVNIFWRFIRIFKRTEGDLPDTDTDIDLPDID
jgi:FtsH-binding integral membrane protein